MPADRIEVIGLDQLKGNLGFLERQVFPQAMSRAINRAANAIRTHTARSVSKEMGVKQKVVRDRIAVTGTNPSSIDRGALVRIRGSALNLIHFKARQTAKGVTASPWGARRLFRSAFVVRGKAVMRREREGAGFVGRLPIKPMRGPGIAKTAAGERIARERQAIASGKLTSELRRQLDLMTARLRK
jgi:hypothetical protein